MANRNRCSLSLSAIGTKLTAINLVWCLFLTDRQKNCHFSALAMNNVDFHVAPMQCYTNLPFRKLCSSLSPTSTYWTEMEKADDLRPNVKEALIQRLGDPRDTFHHNNQEQQHKLVLQLGSNDPQKVKECVQAAMALEYEHLKEINLNCGCPAIDSGGAPTYGASLMKNPSLAATLVEACRLAQQKESLSSHLLNVSVKCRIGLVEHASDLSPSDPSSSSSLTVSPAYDYERLYEFVSHVHKAGANHVILHARPAVLSGLSPVQNRIVPTLNYHMVRQIANDFSNLKVTLNGGITSLSQLLSEYEKEDECKISSFMAGRWMLQRPLDLIGIEELLVDNKHQNQNQVTGIETTLSELDSTSRNTFAIAKGALEDYLDYCMQCATHSKGSMTRTTSDICLPLFLVIEQLRDDYDDDDDYGMEAFGSLDTIGQSDIQFANKVVKKDPPMLSYAEMESLYDLPQDGVAELNDCIGKGGKNKQNKKNSNVNFKRLSSSFKSLVGTKVANKWKRNRAEL